MSFLKDIQTSKVSFVKEVIQITANDSIVYDEVDKVIPDDSHINTLENKFHVDS